MHQINQLPPKRMTPEQRRHEIASLLANGLARLRFTGTEQSATRTEASEFELGLKPASNAKTKPTTKKRGGR